MMLFTIRYMCIVAKLVINMIETQENAWNAMAGTTKKNEGVCM